jgi:hypothetical protein
MIIIEIIFKSLYIYQEKNLNVFYVDMLHKKYGEAEFFFFFYRRQNLISLSALFLLVPTLILIINKNN